MRRFEKGASRDAWRGIGCLLLLGIVVMLFCGAATAADISPVEEVTEVTATPTGEVTEVGGATAPSAAPGPALSGRAWFRPAGGRRRKLSGSS